MSHSYECNHVHIVFSTRNLQDLISDPNNPQSPPYYLARVEVTPEGRKKLGNRQLQAGMPTEMVFRTGERSMLTYLLGPLYKRAAAAMKEA